MAVLLLTPGPPRPIPRWSLARGPTRDIGLQCISWMYSRPISPPRPGEPGSAVVANGSASTRVGVAPHFATRFGTHPSRVAGRPADPLAPPAGPRFWSRMHLLDVFETKIRSSLMRPPLWPRRTGAPSLPPPAPLRAGPPAGRLARGRRRRSRRWLDYPVPALGGPAGGPALPATRRPRRSGASGRPGRSVATGRPRRYPRDPAGRPISDTRREPRTPRA
jgi:hypothetical protein